MHGRHFVARLEQPSPIMCSLSQIKVDATTVLIRLPEFLDQDVRARDQAHDDRQGSDKRTGLGPTFLVAEFAGAITRVGIFILKEHQRNRETGDSGTDLGHITPVTCHMLWNADAASE